MNRFQYFGPNHDISRLCEQLQMNRFQCILWQSILNLKATRASVDSVQTTLDLMHQNTVFPVCLKQISFIALKSIFSLWKLHRNIIGIQPFSSHSVIPFSLYIVIAYTKDWRKSPVETVWTTQLLCVFCNCLHKRNNWIHKRLWWKVPRSTETH